MRVSPQFAGSVGGAPGLAILVPLPPVTSTCRPAAVTGRAHVQRRRRTRRRWGRRKSAFPGPRSTRMANGPKCLRRSAVRRRTAWRRPEVPEASGIDDEAVDPDAGFGTELDLRRRSEPQRQSRPCSGSERSPTNKSDPPQDRAARPALSANPGRPAPRPIQPPRRRQRHEREEGRLPAPQEKHVGS